MGFLLSSAQSSNGEFYQNSAWTFNLGQTRRRITSITTGTGTITFNLVQSTINPKNPFQATTSTQTRRLKITNVAGLNGIYPIAAVGTSSVTIKAPLELISSGPFNPTLQSMATFVTSTGGDIVEPRTLGNLKFKWNLGSTSNMCAMQYQVYDILNQFWSDPEIVMEWKAKYAANTSSWDAEKGPISNDFGGKLFDINVMLKWWMCTVYSESNWKSTSYGLGNDYLTKSQTTSNYDSWPTSGLPCGLWQISARSAASWWKSSSETAAQFASKKDHNDVSKAFSREYNTRAALWIMFQLLFNTDTKPFAYWGSSNRTNEKQAACWSQNGSTTSPNFMQIGSASIVCEDWHS